MRIWTLLVALVLGTGLVLVFLQLHPPKTLRIAAGPEGGAYNQVAKRYVEELARDGITLEVIETAGSVENEQLLVGRQVDAALLQGGIMVRDPEIEAVGSIFFEPMIFLARSELNLPGNPALWRGLKINGGRPGSGTSAAYVDFLAAIELDLLANQTVAIGYDDAISALIADEIDVAVFVAPIDAPYLQRAYGHPDIQFVPLDHSDAIARRLAYATTVTVPPGAISLDPVIPSKPQSILALEARLAVTPDLHPALVNRLTMAAKALHGARDIITDPDAFPSIDGTDLPVNNAARQLITEGPSTWHDWLPYWMAAQVNRTLLLLLPILFIVVPMLRALPGIYAYIMGWKVWQHYPDIRAIEDELDGTPSAEDLERMSADLVELDDRLSKVRLPAAYRQAAYHARMHVELVRKRIDGMRSA
ncbi:TAXI family TRAP transporter solute-binding subunit [Tropicibacter sp. Alg240-R139]|uniref:TAXI family TRAP transporter solute-binding subunit n=1 Tax=Tropicibacter sp. Alg240-R139 TaxID=2305991 RepID=UPI0013E0B5CE|nr:TAXI family TRAP transporter solute-binding subunit [Tropicibacter sp. Alg240-R139]